MTSDPATPEFCRRVFAGLVTRWFLPRISGCMGFVSFVENWLCVDAAQQERSRQRTPRREVG